MYRAIRISKVDDRLHHELVMREDDDLDEGDVIVSIDFSTVNYKDGLAITNKSPVIQRFPMTPGIDFAGTVMASDSPDFAIGDKVVANGWGMSQSHDGGFAERARVPSDWLIRLPSGINTRHAAAIGTAGYTAMLSILALERNGLEPGHGDILVTGASGGVGSVAIALLSKLGYRVVASTGRLDEADYLLQLGAAEVIDRATLAQQGKPIGRERWAGAIDAVGSNTLVNALAQTKYGGVVAACGLAQGTDLPGSVLPFILRGVTLAGIDSVNASKRLRIDAWNRLASDLNLARLDAMVTTVSLAKAPDIAQQILSGTIRGRTLIDVNI